MFAEIIDAESCLLVSKGKAIYGELEIKNKSQQAKEVVRLIGLNNLCSHLKVRVRSENLFYKFHRSSAV